MNILFMGRKKAAAKALIWTLRSGYNVVGVVTDSEVMVSPTANVARQSGIPLWTLEDVYALANEGSLQLDLAVSFVYWRIIKTPLLGLPKRGIINFHPAPLPDYKGTAGYNLAILEERKTWSVTAHYIDEGIDTGGIIDMLDFSIDWKIETAYSLEAKSMRFMLDLYKKTIRQVEKKIILPAMTNDGGKYTSRMEMEAMKEIREGDDVDKKIRAFWFPPYMGAFIKINGKKYTLVNDDILLQLTEHTNIGRES